MASLNLSSLSKGIEALKKLGHAETTFTAHGVEFCLRTITREELAQANEYATPWFEYAQESESSFALADWLQHVKLGTLSFSIMRIGDELDFHDVREVTDDSNPEKVVRTQKHMFVRELVAEWENSLVNVIYMKFKDLTDIAEEKAKEGVKFLAKSPEEVLEDLEGQVDALRESLGLLPLVPTGDTSERVSLQEPYVEESVDTRQLKDALLKPQPVARDGYMYEEPVQEEPLSPAQPSVEYAPTPAQYEPMDEVQQEQERLWQERHERQARQPLNQVPVQVTQGRMANDLQQPVYPANAPQHTQGPSQEHGNVERLRPLDASQQPAAPLNVAPKGKTNPKFYSPQKPR